MAGAYLGGDVIAELTADLDADQRRAVLSEGAPLCIVAAAGSGKTRVLTRRIARRILDGSADATHVLVITFTRRAAGELARRLRAGPAREAIAAGTFHGIAYRLLRQRWEDQRRRPPELVANRTRLVEEVLSEARRGGRRGPSASEVATEIDWARARLVPPDAYASEARQAGRRAGQTGSAVADLYQRYEDRKRERKLIDFDDLLSLMVREIGRDPAYAAAVHWRYRHLFVDEFQDVNPLQHAVLEAWRGGRPDLCVVGDPRQAIYGWNGADGSWLDDFALHHPGATVMHLRYSHRSSPQIVALGQAVLEHDGGEAGAPVASRPDGPVPRSLRFADAEAEARGVAGVVRDARRPGGRWSGIAVLSRTNAQLEPVAAALSAAGIPHRRHGTGSEPIPPVVRAALADMVGPGSVRAWLEETLAGERTSDGPSPLSPETVRATEDLLAQEPLADGRDLRTWLATGGGDVPTDANGVALLSFHAAKGLEWPVVIVVGAVDGLVPHSSARTPQARQEERRLFHVAVTRAEHELVVTWHGDRRSPFLTVMDGAADPVAPPPAELLAVAALGGRAPNDPLADALAAWRRDAARAARVGEAVVLDDRTLAAIVAARPQTLEALSGVPGFGPLMARRHGDHVLAVIREALAGPGPTPRPDRAR